MQMDQEHRVYELFLIFSLALIPSWKQAEEDALNTNPDVHRHNICFKYA